MNQVAIVTGGARRLGSYISIALAENGFDVAVNYNKSYKQAKDVVKQILAIGQKSMAIQANVTDKSDVKKMVKKVYDEFGRIDLLVNNASVFYESRLDKTTERIWDTTIDINLKGTFLCSKAVAPFMLKQNKGKIINLASVGGMQTWTKYLPYSVSKAGVIMLTRILAKELGPAILVNAVAPGAIYMEKKDNKSLKSINLKKIPLLRYGRPSDITDMVVFLAVKGDFITGQTITIDGGKTLE